VFQANAAPTQHEQRAAYLLPLLPTVGVSAKADAQGATVGFPLDAVMQFIVLSLQHKAGNVRGLFIFASSLSYFTEFLSVFLYCSCLQRTVFDWPHKCMRTSASALIRFWSN
jgi:hypothetical protein